MSTDSPLKTQRLAALAFCAAWYIISGSIGLNALIKYVPYRAFIRRLSVTSINSGQIRERRTSGSRLPQA
jgi:hypothetical protein